MPDLRHRDTPADVARALVFALGLFAGVVAATEGFLWGWIVWPLAAVGCVLEFVSPRRPDL